MFHDIVEGLRFAGVGHEDVAAVDVDSDTHGFGGADPRATLPVGTDTVGSVELEGLARSEVRGCRKCERGDNRLGS